MTGRNRFLLRLRTIAGGAFLGAFVALCIGHNHDDVQWTATLAGSWLGGLLCD